MPNTQYCRVLDDEEGQEVVYYPHELPWVAASLPSFAYSLVPTDVERPDVPAYRPRPREDVLILRSEQPLGDQTGPYDENGCHQGSNEIIHGAEYFPHTQDRPMPSYSERLFI